MVETLLKHLDESEHLVTDCETWPGWASLPWEALVLFPALSAGCVRCLSVTMQPELLFFVPREARSFQPLHCRNSDPAEVGWITHPQIGAAEQAPGRQTGPSGCWQASSVWSRGSAFISEPPSLKITRGDRLPLGETTWISHWDGLTWREEPHCDAAAGLTHKTTPRSASDVTIRGRLSNVWQWFITSLFVLDFLFVFSFLMMSRLLWKQFITVNFMLP